MSKITRQLVVTIEVDDSLFPDYGALSRLVLSVLVDRRHGLAVDAIAVRELDREEALEAVTDFWAAATGDSADADPDAELDAGVSLAHVLENILAAP